MKEIKDLNLKEFNKLNEMKEADLKIELAKASKTLFTLRMKKELGEQKQTHLIKFLRRNIAQMKTVAIAKWFNIG